MKKVIAILMIFILSFLLIACSGEVFSFNTEDEMKAALFGCWEYVDKSAEDDDFLKNDCFCFSEKDFNLYDIETGTSNVSVDINDFNYKKGKVTIDHTNYSSMSFVSENRIVHKVGKSTREYQKIDVAQLYRNNVIDKLKKVLSFIDFSSEESYNIAQEALAKKDYQGAIMFLEEAGNYKDAADILGKTSYILGIQLFNEKDFTTASKCFSMADGYYDIDEKEAMANYFAGVSLVNDGKHIDALSHFAKALDSSEYGGYSQTHMEAIIKDLLTSAWIGSYTSNKGATLQVEFKYYPNKDNLYIGYADKSSGYRLVESYTGPLAIGAKTSTYKLDNKFNVEMRFIFYSLNRMSVKCIDSNFDDVIGGTYTTKTNIDKLYYSIDDVVYPTLIVE